SNINEFTYEFDGVKLEMKKSSSRQEVIQVPVQTVQQETVHTPEPTVTVAPTTQPVESNQQPEPVVQNEPVAENLHKITSPMVGTFYQSSSPGAEPYVKVGSKVSANSIVCIVEAMKLFNEIEAEVNGE